MDLSAYRLIDLTQIIVPGRGARPVRIERVPAPLPAPEGLWYMMHRVDITLNHVGTHLSAPYHVDPDGADVSQVPLAQLCGSAAVLDLTAVAQGGIVTQEDIARAAEPADGIKAGDIVLMRFDYDGDLANKRRFTAGAIESLVNSRVHLVGTDLPGIELPPDDPRLAGQFNHQLMTAGICLIEDMAHLDQLTLPRVTVFALPVPIQGLDSFPIRVIALE
ncbi:MAG: cyclase family protein [Anaerolineae bacterium]